MVKGRWIMTERSEYNFCIILAAEAGEDDNVPPI